MPEFPQFTTTMTQGTPKPEARPALAPVALPLPVDDRNPSIFTAVEQPGALRSPRVTPLSPQVLSNILWSAWGANRRGRNGGGQIELFLIYGLSAYHYDARANHLQPLAVIVEGPEDSARCSVAKATPATVQLVYAITSTEPAAGADAAGRELPTPQMHGNYYCADTGSIAGKVFLFASAHGISAVPQPCDRAGLAQRLGLAAGRQVLFTQSIRCPGTSAARTGGASPNRV